MICIIAARSKNGVIGNKGRIPWKIPGEQKRFRQLTTGNAVIMGRRTYEEIGRPLPNRLNIVVSATKKYEGENLMTAPDLSTAIKLAGEKDIFISGGSRLYSDAIEMADIIYLTEIDVVFEGDVFFPDFDTTLFEITETEHHSGDIPYTYITYTRR